MTGTTVAKLRATLGMTRAQFAELLGVHLSAVYRWEGAGDDAKIDPRSLELLAALEAEVRRRATAARQGEFGATLINALLIGGGLLATFYLLDALFGSKPKRSPPRSGRL